MPLWVKIWSGFASGYVTPIAFCPWYAWLPPVPSGYGYANPYSRAGLDEVVVKPSSATDIRNAVERAVM